MITILAEDIKIALLAIGLCVLSSLLYVITPYLALKIIFWICTFDNILLVWLSVQDGWLNLKLR